MAGCHSPAPWRDVENLLTDALVQLLPDPSVTKQWLEALGRSPHGSLLAACIAIDILSGAVAPTTFTSILTHLDPAEPDPLMAFNGALRACPHARELLCASQLPAATLSPPANYVRLLTLREFVTFYLASTHSLSSLDPADLAHARKHFLLAPQLSLSNVRRTWRGSAELVWVTRSDAIERLRATASNPDLPTNLNDAFCLGRDPGEELLAVHYPPGFDAVIRTLPPTTLDANWMTRSLAFLSGPDSEGWGQTHCASGLYKPQPERVHSSFKGLTDNYHAVYIGPVKAVPLDTDRVLVEAFTRVATYLENL
jgi:hypothetical protein